MRSVLLCVLFSLAVYALPLEERKVNWDSKDILSPPRKVPCAEELAAAEAEKIKYCPDGWINYEKSCYMISEKKLTMAKAEQACKDLDTTMFVANFKKEFDMITSLAPMNAYTWIGLFKESEHAKAQWQVDGGLDMKYIDFEFPLSSSKYDNNWSPSTRCAAHWNRGSDGSTHYMACESELPFICERNATVHASTKKH